MPLALPPAPHERPYRVCAALIELIPRGRGARRAAAGFMLIVGMGRLDLYTSRSASLHLLTDDQYGILLLVLAVLVFIDGKFRMRLGGRISAALSAIVLATMAWDVGYIGVTSLLETWFALILLREVFTSHDC